jgi:transcriptional regulator with XRE-family HTH domain
MASEDGQVSFGSLLHKHRLAGGLSQEELADRAGLSRRGISDLERGARTSPYPATVRRLAEALELSVADRSRLLEAAHRSTKALPAGHEAGVAQASAERPRHNLILPLTSFIGRENELAQLETLLAARRMITLVGVGGAG